MRSVSVQMLHTGGAHGGDKQWEKLAKLKGHLIKEYHFDGHKHTRTELVDSNHSELIELTPDEKEIMGIALQQAAHHMNKSLKDLSNAEKHLLERDWIMINRSNAKALYATGHFDDGTRLRIHGNTGWSVEIFVDHYLNIHDLPKITGKLSFSLKPLPVYFKSIDANAQFHGWYQLCLNGLNHLKWERVEQIPDPDGDWVGIGARS